MCMCVRACVRVCGVCARACVRACVCVYVCLCVRGERTVLLTCPFPPVVLRKLSAYRLKYRCVTKGVKGHLTVASW